MRKRYFIFGLAALALAAIAYAATTKTVTIRAAGFQPRNVTIDSGDSVRWTNADTVNHQVVATGGQFASPIIRPNQSYTRRFDTAGTYRYRDALEPSEEPGTVVVKGPPPAISLAASAPIVTYGGQVILGGRVTPARSGEQVLVYGRKYGEVSYVQLGVVLTGDQGIWSYTVEPEILTTYQAQWGNRKSAEVQTAVEPKLTVKRVGSWFVARAQAAKSFKNRWVYVQRRSTLGQWVNVRKVTLGSSGAQRFKLFGLRNGVSLLPRGLSRIRLFMTVNQAGVGYLASESNLLLVRR